ncbi:MAG: hypothetical protein PHQ74_08000 [Crocinitomicaceae bacterium]|nr:hypothetical protein [Crocinitomicaceae bacterium]
MNNLSPFDNFTFFGNMEMNKFTRRFILLASIVAVHFFSAAQLPETAKKKKDKFPSYFGLQYKPLIPGNFLGKSSFEVTQDQLYAKFSQKLGYSFGASVRIGLTKLISLETGINMVQRNYGINFAVADSNLYAENRFEIVNYDIPLNLLVYIQLSEKLFMNTSIGGSFIYYPTNVATKMMLDKGHAFIHEGRRVSKVAAEFNANVGMEWRTEKNGIFYVGMTGKVPFKPIYNIAAIYSKESYTKTAVGEMTGTYLSLDFRYYFPNIAQKGKQFIHGPVDQ